MIYNFALFNVGLISEFQSKICKVSRVFQLHSLDQVPFDNIAAHFYPRKGFFLINSSNISYKRALLPDDIEKIETSIKAQIPQESSSFVFLLGPTLTGKTRAGKVLSELGMKSIDFLAIIEDTKQRLSTEEEPKEDLTLSEIIEGIQFEAKKNPAKVFFVDGIPPSEVIFAKDPDYPIPEINEEKAEDELAYDEDPSIQEKIKIVYDRMQILFKKLQVLSVIHFKVPFQVLEKRARIKFETPEEEDLSNEQKFGIFES